MRTIARYILLTAMRDRLFIALLIAIAASAGISSVLAKTSMEEQQAMAVVFSAAVARLILTTGLVVFVAFHVREAYESREIDVLLSRPISRTRLVFSYWIGFSLVAALLSGICIGVIALVGPQNMQGFAVWGASLTLEALLVVAISLFAALMVRSAVVAVMIGLSLYVLSRMMGFFLATATSHILFQDPTLNEIARSTLKGVALFMPRLDFFADTSWLVYGIDLKTDDLSLFILQGAIYIPLILLATVFDFRRKQF